ncbi:hypothetical protein BH09ACT7_BH09ACT7_57810 [soil metagenome]
MENLCGYAQRDLAVPMLTEAKIAGVPVDLRSANVAARDWCVEVNAAVHSEICAVPNERLLIERELLRPLPSLRLQVGAPSVIRKVDRLSCIRYASARYSVPTRLIGTSVAVVVDHGALCIVEPATGMIVAEHELGAPGSASVLDDHYDGPRPAPSRGPRPKTAVEQQFCALGDDAQAFLVGAAAIGNTRLGSELEVLLGLGAAHGTDTLTGALRRAVAFRRFRCCRRALHPGCRRGNTSTPHRRGRVDPGSTSRPDPIPGRIHGRTGRRRWCHVMTTAPANPTKPVAPLSVPPLAADLDAGLRRLKLAAIRRTAPEVLLTAKTQRWTPEEVLRTLIETELAARDASNVVNRLKAAAFPVTKTLDAFDVASSSIQPKVFDYLSSLEWIRTQQNLAIVGPAGTGKSHTLIGLGVAAIHAGHKVRYFTAADLVDTLYRGLADNTVGKIIESLLRVDLIILDELGFAPLDDTATQLLFRLVAGAYERRSLAIGSHWPFQEWGRFLPEQTTAVSILDRLLHHATVVITDGQSYRMKDAQHRKENPQPT